MNQNLSPLFFIKLQIGTNVSAQQQQKIITMSTRKILLFTANDVIVYRLGQNGWEEFFPGEMEFNIMPESDFKAWLICRGNGRRLVFNGIVPRNVAVMLNKCENLCVLCGKMASSTYNEEETKKPIATMWKFCFDKINDKENFVFLMNGASAPFRVPQLSSEKATPAKNNNKENKKNVTKKSSAATNKKGSKNTKSTNKIETIEENAPTTPVLSKKSNNVVIDLTSSDSDDDYATESNFDSFESLGNPGSPKFAQLQDIMASLGR